MRVLALVVAAIVTLGLGNCGKSDESLPVGSPPIVPNWAEQQGFADNERAKRGAEIFAQVGCLTCHTYLGAGSQNLGAPDLTAIGKESPRSAEQYAAYIADPSKFGNQVMPKFQDLGRRNLLYLGEFLRVSKGER
jgi:mono/diheme cytochrome c family protein